VGGGLLVYALDSRRRKKRVLLGRFGRGTRSFSSAVRIVKAGKLVGKRCCYLAIFFGLAGQVSVAKQKKKGLGVGGFLVGLGGG